MNRHEVSSNNSYGMVARCHAFYWLFINDYRPSAS